MVWGTPFFCYLGVLIYCMESGARMSRRLNSFCRWVNGGKEGFIYSNFFDFAFIFFLPCSG